MIKMIAFHGCKLLVMYVIPFVCLQFTGYHELTFWKAEHDYMAVIYNHRGHGNSVNDLVELGYFYTEDIQGISIYIIWLLRDAD